MCFFTFSNEESFYLDRGNDSRILSFRSKDFRILSRTAFWKQKIKVRRDAQNPKQNAWNIYVQNFPLLDFVACSERLGHEDINS